jgi:23S rRNA (pseudouridine1915-N3)-methyltransferase
MDHRRLRAGVVHIMQPTFRAYYHLEELWGEKPVRLKRIVALDERGTAVTTVALASKLKNWQLDSDDVAIVIGGPDGLDPGFKQAAHERMRLSDLTLPHAMVRVLLVEQLYRAWSINANHPYHRE